MINRNPTKCDPGPCSVLLNLAPLHHEVAGRLDVDFAAPFEGDVLALDGDRSVLLQRDAGIAALEHDGLANGDDELLFDLELVILGDGRAPSAGDISRFVLAHGHRQVLASARGLVPADSDRAVPADGIGLARSD